MISRATSLLSLFFISVAVSAQGIDSVALDLKNLTDLEFVYKYSMVFEGSWVSKQDIKVTKLIWSLPQVRKANQDLKEKGGHTVTMVVDRPTKANKFYLVGHYQIPAKDLMPRMAFYRVDTLHNQIEYQDLDDFAHDRWKRIR